MYGREYVFLYWLVGGVIGTCGGFIGLVWKLVWVNGVFNVVSFYFVGFRILFIYLFRE